MANDPKATASNRQKKLDEKQKKDLAVEERSLVPRKRRSGRKRKWKPEATQRQGLRPSGAEKSDKAGRASGAQQAQRRSLPRKETQKAMQEKQRRREKGQRRLAKLAIR